MNTDAIEKACALLGSQAELARTLKLSPSQINQWCNASRPVPAEHCPEIERALNGLVRCEELRPDIAWNVVRGSAKPELAAHPDAPPAIPIADQAQEVA